MPAELAPSLCGLLAFPVTPFHADGSLNVDAFRQHVDLLLSYGVRAVFPACGTGEFQSLTATEYRAVVEACVAEAAGRVPVVAGVGFGFGAAAEMARTAEAVGADGVLVFPPYLGTSSIVGQVDYYGRLAQQVGIGLVLYQRPPFEIAPSALVELAAVENIVALKDGTGNVELIQRQRSVVDDPDFVFLNGVPTAELVAPAMMRCDVRGYSSALLNVIPEFAVDFHAALSNGDDGRVEALTRDVLTPFVALRDRVPGYAVSLIKAGVRLRGRDVGHVRPPLTEPVADDVAALAGLLEQLDLASPLADAWNGRELAAAGERREDRV